MRKPRVISLFSGCGGMDLGFLQAGYEIVYANDINPHACETYVKNIGNHIINQDVKMLHETNFPESIDVVIGGFPCQGFSMAGKRDVNDERNLLYREMKNVIAKVQPRMFVAENVRGLISMEKGKILAYILDDFASLGYHVSYQLFNAADYGVPQERFRIIIVGIKKEAEVQFPSPTHTRHSTVREAIADIIPLHTLPNHQIHSSWPEKYNTIMRHIGEGQKLCNARHSASNVYTWHIPEVYGETTNLEKSILLTIAKNRRHKKYGNKDGNPLSSTVISELSGLPNEDIQELLNSLVQKEYLIVTEDGKYDITKASFTRFRRLLWDEPSPTILTNFDNPRNFLHPSENRPLSVREVARLQSFPDDFIFHGPIKEQYRQVGNAVPPRLAYMVSTTLKEYL